MVMPDTILLVTALRNWLLITLSTYFIEVFLLCFCR